MISGPKWPEPVEVKKIDNDGTYIHIVGATTTTGQHIDQLIPVSELSDIQIRTIRTDFRSEPWKVFLALETKRYRFASLYDPLLAMNASKVDPLPHQIEAVYGYVLKLPRIRFLIADDPGAGKTIMAGLIIKELKLRKLAKRILIVVPGHLKDQWRRELKDRFEETFVVIDRGLLGAHYAENVWERENQIITSMDFAKRDEILPSLSSAQFDLVVVDEAHKMSAYRYGDKTVKTNRYRLGEALSKLSTPHLLFLTATPHRGDPENFRLFMDLLEPGFFATTEMLQESIENEDNPLFIRRMKEDLKDFEGKPLFLPRYVKTVPFRLSDDEKTLYNELSRYVKEQYNKALRSDKRRNVAFALVILQRRLASSTFAILKSLERRKKRLEDLLKGAEKSQPKENVFDFEEVEDLSEEERWQEEELWETLSVAENRQELEAEIRTISGLIEKARSIIQKESEVKVNQLKRTMEELKQKFPKKKILIFTEAKDTLEYLEKKIRAWGYSINTIHGSMKLEDRVEAEKIFKNETQIMVATEAAGEGINLQFCHLMINYDIPWNPNRLEQRMGRIHRYGQTKEVYVFNLVAEDTREGKVLVRLFEKLNEIRNALKSDKVFDVISEVLYGKNLSQLMVEAAASARDINEILKEIDITIDEEYISRVKENLGESLATRYIDYTRLKEMAEKARENRLIPEYTESFFKKAFLRAGGKLRERKDEYLAIESSPYEIRTIAGEDNFKKRYGPLLKAYPKITFDKDIGFRNPDVEFVSFGHPLFEAVLEWVDRELSTELKKGAVFTDPEGNLDGYVLFYEGEVKDGTGSIAGKSLFAYYFDSRTAEIRTISPTIMWDLSEGKDGGVQGDVDDLKKRVLQQVISGLKTYMSKLQTDRNRQAQIKEKYGVKSLDQLVIGLDGDLIGLYNRKDTGANVDLAIRNKEEQKRKYEKGREELQDIISKERNLTMSMPVFLGTVRVKPALQVGEAMQRDEEIERLGMEIAMRYEREAHREPEDVSKENLGFDIRSKEPEGKTRYVEVKARAGIGPVALTQNEWFKAQRLGNDYYLYAVWNAAKDPNAKPRVVQDPARNLKVEEKIEVVRYIIPASEIEQKSR
ncbi:MAG TPA: helicase-related protein [Candidatus Bathyarchaeia archaeon]|nr:helicase-related protein [Candidatus Bathyarchaeia archaeon]